MYVVPLVLIPNFIPCSDGIHEVISISLNLLRFVLCPNKSSVLGKLLCTTVSAYPEFSEYNIIYMSVRSCWPMVLFSSDALLCIFIWIPCPFVKLGYSICLLLLCYLWLNAYQCLSYENSFTEIWCICVENFNVLLVNCSLGQDGVLFVSFDLNSLLSDIWIMMLACFLISFSWLR